MKRWREISGAASVLLPIPARLCSCPKRQQVCCTGLMWDTQQFPSWLFDMTPGEPSVLLSSARPHLGFAFCTVPISLPSWARGKWLCLEHVVRASLQVLGMAPFFHHLYKLVAQELISKTPRQWGGLPRPRDLPLLHPRSFCRIPSRCRVAGHLPAGIASPKAGASGAIRYPGALGGRMSACDSVIISMATACGSTSISCSTVTCPEPGSPISAFLLEGTSTVWAPTADDGAARSPSST